MLPLVFFLLRHSPSDQQMAGVALTISAQQLGSDTVVDHVAAARWSCDRRVLSAGACSVLLIHFFALSLPIFIIRRDFHAEIILCVRCCCYNRRIVAKSMPFARFGQLDRGGPRSAAFGATQRPNAARRCNSGDLGAQLLFRRRRIYSHLPASSQRSKPA